MNLRLRSILASSAVLVAACVRVTDVPGPDGETAHLIACRTSSDCYERATEVCGGGEYVIRSNGSTTNGAGGAVYSSTEILVSCKSDLKSVPQEQPAEANLNICSAASHIEGEFATYWVDRTPGSKRLDDLPSLKDFIDVCAKMPDRVQRCLHEHWRQSHAQTCEAVLSRLDAGQRREVDALFLVAPPPASTQ